MKYEKTLKLKNGKEMLLRNGTPSDAEEVLYNFNQTHAETDNLLTYPDENKFTIEIETEYLTEMESSDKAIEILAVVDGSVVGTAGFDAVGNKEKIKHRAEFGISVLKDYWGIGIGRALMEACIECAKKAGYAQLELDVIGSNESAMRLYKSVGFTEYGRNPKGFKSRTEGYQELVYMRLEL